VWWGVGGEGGGGVYGVGEVWGGGGGGVCRGGKGGGGGGWESQLSFCQDGGSRTCTQVITLW